MRTMLVLAPFFIISNYVSPKDIKDLTPWELLKLGQDISQVHVYEVQPGDVKFYLLTKPESEPILLTAADNDEDVVDPTKNTKIVIHGWLENYKRSWYKNVGEQYLKNHDVNFIEVDWERAARVSYVASAKATRSIGGEVARFIQDSGLSPRDIHLIGHSLGAHVAGFAGKKVFAATGQKLQRITGLDPAGPYFRHSSVNPSDRLDKDDAEVVDAIHTDGGFYGYENPIGTLDIYVNGGQRMQPGCFDEFTMPESLGDLLESSFCSHARSTKYFIEWIDAGKFNCKLCKPVLGVVNFLGDKCSLHHVYRALGSDDVTVNVTGICFARTNKEEPYLSLEN